MKKKNRNPSAKVHEYAKYAVIYNGIELSNGDARYYGVHRDGGRVKLDIKRMRKLGNTGIPDEVLDAASALPRNTTYFLPQRIRRYDYVINRFRDKLRELALSWYEYKQAFSNIASPSDVAERVRVERLSTGIDDNEDATVAGLIAGAKRLTVYERLWISQCAQFIHQIATELDALLLWKCTAMGFDEKDVNRGRLHSYLNATAKNGRTLEELDGYRVYAKFFSVWNMLKHNSEDLFDKLKRSYPDMLLTDRYISGKLSQFYLRIGDGYIERMLEELLPFYKSLCSEIFNEDVENAEWNYDDYFIEMINKKIQSDIDPLGV